MRTERDLAGALRQAAERAPGSDLLAGIGERRRRRTRRRAQLLAAAAVVVVVGAGTAATKGIFVSGGGEGIGTAAPHAAGEDRGTVGEPEVTRTVTVAPRDPVKSPAGTPVERLWPKALFQMPAKNADGWRYRPVTGINATQVLLMAESSFEKAGKIEIYDTETGKARLVTEVPATKGLKQYYPQSATTDGTNVAWYATGTDRNRTRVAEIWWAPLSGGKARKTYTTTEYAIDAIALDGDQVVWSAVKGGVHRKPLAGGTVEPLSDENLHLIHWPWAGDVGDGPDTLETNQTKLVNLAEGTEVEITARPGTTGLRCGPTWCQGRLGGRGIIQRPDGSGLRELSGAGFMGGLSRYPVLDRFLRSGDTVYDLKTGKQAAITRTGSWSGVGTSSEASTILYWGVTKEQRPARYWVVNLAAVPPER
ncbi:TolB family protein [Nonomuraea sp. NPDC050783]|uniref:TolB family protein n=1 Tax=Nonomuraea sp. NPDC050783 TaxID=3154634 RepID=UPI0034664BC3